ncbi:helix-turn-helix domain-containing protein [Paenibacillus sp. GCM10027626]|uniref:helix-turn-helix domain-containing protein n=1 Tax=Paenibacillus sp. GCM10027626 TaxID=3273411 RepID=UPI00362A231E
MAHLIHPSPNYTIAIFREVIGSSPINYIHQLRIMEACSLLINSDMTVAEISNHLGYYDTSYFFRIFKKYTSMSPTEFMARGYNINVSQLFL